LLKEEEKNEEKSLERERERIVPYERESLKN